MLLNKYIGSIFIIVCFTICNAINIPPNATLIEESPLKMYLVEDIVRKICNISLNTFSNKTIADKAILLVKIEENLNKAARALGIHGEKYVNLIMKGVKLKAFENNHAESYKQASERRHIMDDKPDAGHDDIKVKNFSRQGPPKFNTNSKSKVDLVENIANKIELLASGYLSHAKTQEERQKMIEDIIDKFVKLAESKHATLLIKNEDIKNYVDLIAKGIELLMDRDALKRRRMEFVYTNNINLNKGSQDHNMSDIIEAIKPDSVHDNELDRGSSKPNSVILRIDKKTTLKPKSSCDSIIEEACQKIKSLKTLRCTTDNSDFNILRLCDGVGDCLDFSDENQCGQQAIEIIQTANRLIAYIDTSINAHHCFPDLSDKSLLAKQSKVLSDVLKNQLTFLEKHSLKAPETLSGRIYNTEKSIVRETVKEAVNVVDSLTAALSLSMCPDINKDNKWRPNKEDLLKEIRQVSRNKTEHEICKCNGQNCLNMQKCSPRCQSICFDTYSLSQLSCDAVSGVDIVSLDMICDGKLDCYDELDEKDCSEDVNLAKFEATHMYDYILKEIELKTASITFEPVRSRLQSLHALVTKLQKLSLKRQPDVLEVKRVRQACFEEISKVFESSLLYMRNKENDLFNVRFFLMTVNERLISALKRSHSGNDKIISSDGCVCRANKCALPRCSKSCIRACSAEPQLTRFFCGQLTEQLNNSVPVELVCNGKLNCPNGEDEKDCKKDVCRTHHLIVLRHKLQDVGKQYEGTALGEAFRSWRIKVTATLMIAEDNERPTPVVLYDLVRNILDDLVMTYAALEHRRDNTTIFNEFYSWSRVVINMLKSCSH